MADDYRNTKYCPSLTELSDKKNKVKEAILKEHPKAKDMYTYISNNNLEFKQQFIAAYNGKCSYCGVSLGIISWNMFEIDHFIPKNSARFKKKSQAGYIENLVLSCYNCNRAKSNLELPDVDYYKVFPDDLDICRSFIRDDDYYIRISEERSDDESVKLFYKKLGLGSQIHRLDYLLMNMIGLRDSLKSNLSAYIQLNEAIELMKKKRR